MSSTRTAYNTFPGAMICAEWFLTEPASVGATMTDLAIPDLLRDHYVAELTEAAYPVALAHGTAGSSVDVELDIWRAIDEALSDRRWRRLQEAPIGARRTIEREVLAVATEAAYRTALRHGFKGSFLDLELDLWQALQRRAG